MLAPGTRVQLRHDVERYPHFIAPKGATGVVVDIGAPEVFAVRLDEPLLGAEDWDNEVHWYDGDPSPEEYLETLPSDAALEQVGHRAPDGETPLYGPCPTCKEDHYGPCAPRIAPRITYDPVGNGYAPSDPKSLPSDAGRW